MLVVAAMLLGALGVDCELEVLQAVKDNTRQSAKPKAVALALALYMVPISYLSPPKRPLEATA